ncbi:bifunctional polynucleotide phosphatase/kinase, partial [Tremellales sp. Uapishka_1]
MSGIKRPIEGEIPQAKRVHSFFAGPKPAPNFVKSPATLVHYLHLDPFVPVASGSTGPLPASPIPITFYDLDGTLIKTRKGGRFPSGSDDWVWWHPSVPAKLKSEWEAGRHLVVLSNQGDGRPKVIKEWRGKLPLIAAKLAPEVPLRVLAALARDVYRKPNTGMFDVVRELYRAKGFEIDVENSVYVGDAAGRSDSGVRRKDHGDTDYKMALNAGLRFLTPEEHFLSLPRPPFPEPPIGFRPSDLGALAALPEIVPSHTPIARTEVELVLFVGPPASGKTSFFRRHFADRYEHVNQDTLKTRDRCLSVAEHFLRAGKAVVVDNTNRNRATRAHWIQLAEKMNVSVRLFHFICPIELAKHNSMYRGCYGPADEPARTPLPMSAFFTYTAAFEKPTADEGFDEIRAVNFVWRGTAEQRALWDRYLLEVK